MLRGLLCFLFFFLIITSNAQIDGKIVSHCSYYGDNAKLNRVQICLDNGSFAFNLPDYSQASKVLDDILTEVGLPRNFLLVECPNIDNCKAVNLQAKKGLIRYIIYDDAFLKGLDSTTNTYWASVSIFAHEIAHHLSGHTLDSLGSRPDKELEADRFSGFVLYKLGATLDEAQAAMKQIGAVPIVTTHPPLNNRLAAIRNGWNDGWSSNYRQRNNKNEMPKLKSLDEIAIELYDKAYLENILGKHEDAIKSANTAIYLRNNYAEAYVQRGLAEANLLRTAQAVKTLDTALNLDPSMNIARVYKGRAYALAKNYSFAEMDFIQAMQKSPTSAEAYAERALMRIDQGLYDKAILDAEKALDLMYKDAHIPLGTIGFAYFRKKQYEKSVIYFSTALDYNPIYEYASKWGLQAYKLMEAEKKKPKPPVRTTAPKQTKPVKQN